MLIKEECVLEALIMDSAWNDVCRLSKLHGRSVVWDLRASIVSICPYEEHQASFLDLLSRIFFSCFMNSLMPTGTPSNSPSWSSMLMPS